MDHQPIGVIGAGPAGMTAAYLLAREGRQVELFEASPGVGGMARTIELWGQKVDLGPHRFFSSDRRVNELWLSVAGRDYAMVRRLTRILYSGRYFHYPLRPFDALLKLGPVEALRCVASYGAQRLSGGSAADAGGSFEHWVTDRFGRRLFEIFFKTYSEKLWGIACSDLDADFAAQRIKKFSLGEAIKTALRPGTGGHRTLVDEFAYPHDGTGSIYERMAGRFTAMGGKLHLGTPVRKVVARDGTVTGIELEDGAVRPFGHVISSMPLTLMVRALPGAPEEVRAAAGRLRFRNTILVYLQVAGKDLFPDNWLYVHSPELRTGRITNFRNWVPQLHGGRPETILALEYWCYDDDPLWSENEEALVALARREIAATGLLGDAPVTAGQVVRIPRCYPVYDRGYRAHLKPVEDYLRGIAGLSVIGRYGAFKYNNQDHSILMGILAAENLIRGTTHDLWDINTDYESYQESAQITATGLEPIPARP